MQGLLFENKLNLGLQFIIFYVYGFEESYLGTRSISSHIKSMGNI